MNKEKLKEIAISLVELPAHFQPVIEDYFEDENGEGEAMFSWADEQQEEGISISLDPAGNLISLSIERNKTNTVQGTLTEHELKEQAERFICSHYPNALQNLTFYETKKLKDAHRFYYEQIVMDIPLPHAGCFIDVEPSGEIVKFKYYGLQPEPVIPKMLIAKEKLMEHVKNRLDLRLTIANLNASILKVTEEGLHLVYDVELFMKYKAGAVEPTLTIIHDEDEDDLETYVSLPEPSAAIRKDVSIEDMIGITEEMEVIREGDLGSETGIVWRDPNWKMEESDLSINNYFQSRNEATVKAFILKKTGELRGFIWFKKRSGDLCLNREECYQKAINFLQMVSPKYYPYMQLIVRNHEDEPDDDSKNEVFNFRMHNGHGTPIYLERALVTVNKQTGLIDCYSGPSFDIEQFSHLASEPVFSKKEAQDIFLEHLDFELVWEKNYDGREEYTLAYRACDRQTRKPIRYIDAITGAVITEKE